MPRTMAEKILAKAAGIEEIDAGKIVMANVDLAMTHDLTGPLSVAAFKKIGENEVWDPEKIVVIFDHQVRQIHWKPPKSLKCVIVKEQE